MRRFSTILLYVTIAFLLLWQLWNQNLRCSQSREAHSLLLYLLLPPSLHQIR